MRRSQHPAYRLASPLTPVWRAPGTLQVGLDEGAFIVRDAPEPAREVVRAFRSWRTAAEIAALFDIDRLWLDAFVADLLRRRVLVRRSAPPELGLIGSGPLARLVARLLVQEQCDVWAFDAAFPEHPVDAAARRHQWLQLARPGEGRLRLHRQWQPAVTAHSGLVLVASGAVEIDRLYTDHLVRVGRPHLVVAADAERGVVGPLVVPARTPCLRCRDRDRARTDPAWPGLLTALMSTAAEPTPLIRQWAAVTAVAQAQAWLLGEPPETLGATVELPTTTFALETRRWPLDPRCSCAEAWARAAS